MKYSEKYKQLTDQRRYARAGRANDLNTLLRPYGPRIPAQGRQAARYP